jgi:hypothetical protein
MGRNCSENEEEEVGRRECGQSDKGLKLIFLFIYLLYNGSKINANNIIKLK